MARIPSIVSRARAAELLVAGGEREGERVEDQRVGRQPVLADRDVVDLARHRELGVGRLRHPAQVAVDGQRDDRRAVRRDVRQHRVACARGRSPG